MSRLRPRGRAGTPEQTLAPQQPLKNVRRDQRRLVSNHKPEERSYDRALLSPKTSDMDIEQICKVTLTTEEVRRALTAYIRDQTHYKTDFKSYQEVIDYEVLLNGNVLAMWGDVPETEPIVTDPTAGTGTRVPQINSTAALETA